MRNASFKIIIVVAITIVLAASYWLYKHSNISESPDVIYFNDTLTYGKEDYDQMRAYYQSDSIFSAMLADRAALGDTHVIKVRKLLGTPYGSRDASGITDKEIGAMIYAFYATRDVFEKFNKIDDELEKLKLNNGSLKSDSLMEAIEKLR